MKTVRRPAAAPPAPRPGTGRRGAHRDTGASDTLFLGLDLLLVLALGGLHSLAATYTHAWVLQLLAVGGLAFRVSRASPRRAALLGWAFATAWFVAGTFWLYISMHRYGGLPGWMAGAAVLALSAFLALYFAAAMALFGVLRRNHLVVDTLVFAACWLLAELARGLLFTGFPWAASGYSHVDSPLAQLAPWVGVYGIGWVAALLGALAVIGFRSGVGPGGLGAISAVAVVGGLAAMQPVNFTRGNGSLQLTLLQSNVAQDEKFAEEKLPQALAWAATTLQSARGDLVLAPETIVPLLPDQLPEGYWAALAAGFQRGDRAALIGVPLGSFEAGYTNSAVGLSRETAKWPGGFYRYDKHHLVPFGEFIPTGFRWFTELMNIPLGDFNRGPVGAPSFEVKGQRIAPNICYEDLFGEELAAHFREPERAPTVFANLSNIGWFGDTIALAQHLNISRMRTLEFQRPMLRATNTGVTAVIDHTGRITHQLPPLAMAVLEAPVEGRQGMTPYASWAARWWLWPLFVGALLSLLIVVPLRRS